VPSGGNKRRVVQQICQKWTVKQEQQIKSTEKEINYKNNFLKLSVICVHLIAAIV